LLLITLVQSRNTWRNQLEGVNNDGGISRDLFTNIINDDLLELHPDGGSKYRKKQTISKSTIGTNRGKSQAFEKQKFQKSYYTKEKAKEDELNVHLPSSGSDKHQNDMKTDSLPTVFKVVMEEIDPALLPAGYKLKQEEMSQTPMKVKLEQIDPSLLPPGYKLNQEDSNEAPLVVKMTEIDPSLLPPGYNLQQEGFNTEPTIAGYTVYWEDIDPSLLPQDYKVKSQGYVDDFFPTDFVIPQKDFSRDILPVGFQMAETLQAPPPNAGFAVEWEEIDPSLLPADYRMKQEEVEAVAPGYVIQLEEIDPTLLPPDYKMVKHSHSGFVVKLEDIDRSLLPPDFKIN